MKHCSRALSTALVLLVAVSSNCIIDPPDLDPDGGVDAGARDAGVDAGVDGGLVVVNLGPHPVQSGRQAQIQLSVSGGAAPYSWSPVEKPVELAWAQLTATTGLITGVAGEAYEGDRTFRVEVRELATGRTARGDVLIRVGPCATGDVRDCEQARTELGCYVGKQRCENGKWSAACEGSELSGTRDLCGSNCGVCGAEASRCLDGQCVCGESALACGTRQHCCTPHEGGTQSCMDVDSDPMHCGGCRVVCPGGENSYPVCNEGRCGAECDAGYARCGDDVGTLDCQTHLLTDARHCGTCGNQCPREGADGPAANQHYTGTCGGGVCLVACDADWKSCDGNAVNGCEAHLPSNVLHCGDCDRPCLPPNGGDPIGTPTCDAGTCGWNCGAEGQKCGDVCQLYVDPQMEHCGQCNNACVVDASKHVASVTCEARPEPTRAACRITACAQFFADCDGDYSNGCEVDKRSNPDHCGACGASCGNVLNECINSVCCGVCGETAQCCSPNRCTYNSAIGEDVCG